VLPAEPDEMLIDELAQVVSAGWRLIDRSAAQDQVRHLLLLASPKPYEMYSTVALRFMAMLDQALERGTDYDAVDEGPATLLTEDQSRGLRILFGLHPDYRWANVAVRREEGGALLLGKDDVKANTFYKTYEADALRLTLASLKETFGQETLSTRRSYESVRRYLYAVVGENHRVETLTFNNVYRSLIDGLGFVRNWFQLEEPELIEEIGIRELSGVLDHELEHRQGGAYRLTFSLPRTIDAGQEFAWSYERSYRYRPGIPLPTEDRTGISGRNNGYEVEVRVQFTGEVPSVIWWYSRRKTLFEIEVTSKNLLVPDEMGSVLFPSSRDTSELRVYGVAWRW